MQVWRCSSRSISMSPHQTLPGYPAIWHLGMVPFGMWIQRIQRRWLSATTAATLPALNVRRRRDAEVKKAMTDYGQDAGSG